MGYFEKHVREARTQGAKRPNHEQAFELLRAGVIAAAQVGLDTSITNLLPKADELAFTGLAQLVRHSAQSNQH